MLLFSRGEDGDGDASSIIFRSIGTTHTALTYDNPSALMALPPAESLILCFILVLSILLIFLLLFCKPWRFLSFLSSRSVKTNDLEKPLVANDLDFPWSQSRNHNSEGPSSISREIPDALEASEYVGSHMPPLEADVNPGRGLIMEVHPHPSDDFRFGQTIKTNWCTEKTNLVPKEESLHFINSSGDANEQHCFVKTVHLPRSSITLEVISGPSCGHRCSLQSSNNDRLSLTIGRGPASDLVLTDSEVSGRHARINWNSNKSQWELLDTGSLNGTTLNSRAVNLPDPEQRQWSEPVGLENGDAITLGTTSKLVVHICEDSSQPIPFRVGMASDAMALRRGAKKLPMEDVSCCQWPLPGVAQFGLFGIFDGHGGSGASKAASKILPNMVASILLVPEIRAHVHSDNDASDVLRDAFHQTEAALNHQYEGCCATVLLVWSDLHEGFFAQCANVGDSACIFNIDGKQVLMTEDHRITSESERARLTRIGGPLRNGETRLCGLNVARMLGDKFLKEQDTRFSSSPYISQVIHITRGSKTFALLASDGLWDVLSTKKANQLILQYRENSGGEEDKEDTAEKIAKVVLSEARTLRTKDNTSVIYLDFNTNRTTSHCSV